MKYKLLFIVLLIPNILFADLFSYPSDISFPESLFFIHRETGFRIMLGLPPEFVLTHFGKPSEKRMTHQFRSPDYQRWEIVYEDFIIDYRTYDFVITYINIITDSFYTSKGIKIGSTVNEVINAYGNPRVTVSRDGYEIMLYDRFIPEINSDSEYTTIQFTIKNNVVVRVIMAIGSWV
ncbi:MAG: hypothetical protein FWD87_10555 [Spirochaetaceae bacterium]|nr:hypothetical protein [Spirochaetaceae bacterium]